MKNLSERTANGGPPSRLFAICFALLIGLAAIIRGVYLSEFPPQVHNDESAMAIHGYLPIHNSSDQWALFGSSFAGHPNFGYWLGGLPSQLFGEYSLWTLRIGSTIMGTLSLVFLALFVSQMYGRRLALYFLVFAIPFHLHFHYSRTGFHYIHAVFLMSIISFAFGRFLHHPSNKNAFITGISMGLGALVYPATHVLIFAMAAALLIGRLPCAPAGGVIWRRPLPFFKFVGIFLLGLALSFGPQLIYILSHGFLSRLNHTFILHPHSIRHIAPMMGDIPVTKLGVVWFNLLLTLRFFYKGDSGEQYNFHECPYPIAFGVIALAGLLLLLVRALKREAASIYLAVTVLTTVAASALMVEANFSPHLILFSVLIPFCIALGWDFILSRLRAHKVFVATTLTTAAALWWSAWNWSFYNRVVDPARSRLSDNETRLFNLPIDKTVVRQIVNISPIHYNLQESFFALLFPNSTGTKLASDDVGKGITQFLAEGAKCPCIFIVPQAQGESSQKLLEQNGRRVSRYSYPRITIQFLYVE